MLDNSVDAHVHVWAEDCERYPKIRATPIPAAMAEFLLDQLDAAGVAQAVLIQPSY